jgi:hypothetical protein
MEYSAPWDTASGRYYWTNAYIWESPYNRFLDDPNWERLRGALNRCVSEACTIERFRVESWFGTGTASIDFLEGRPGFLLGADRGLLIDAARLTAPAGAAGRWYKPLRGLLGPADVVGGVLSDEIMGWLSFVVAGELAGVPIVNWRREPIGEITVSPNVHPWQLRHGTKRSARRVLFPR